MCILELLVRLDALSESAEKLFSHGVAASGVDAFPHMSLPCLKIDPILMTS
jgi:hypothetical protein